MTDNLLAEWLREGEPAPLGDPPMDSRPRGRSRLLLTLAAGSWLVVAGMAWQVLAPDEPRQPEPAPPPPVTPPVLATPPVLEPRREPTGELAAVARALVAVRRSVSEGGDEPGRRYVDLAAAEAVEWVGDVAVVTVLAYVLEGDSTGWVSGRTTRYGVAVPVEGGQLEAPSIPWVLPLEGAPEELAWAPVSDPELIERATEALERARYDHIGELRLEAAGPLGQHLRARVTARAPGEPDEAEHLVWLRTGATDVLGWAG